MPLDELPQLKGPCPFRLKTASTAEDVADEIITRATDSMRNACAEIFRMIDPWSKESRVDACNQVRDDPAMRQAYSMLRNALFRTMDSDLSRHDMIYPYLKPTSRLVVDLFDLVQQVSEWVWQARHDTIPTPSPAKPVADPKHTRSRPRPYDYTSVIDLTTDDDVIEIDERATKRPRQRTPEMPRALDETTMSPDRDAAEHSALSRSRIGCVICNHPKHVAPNCTARTIHGRSDPVIVRWNAVKKELYAIKDNTIRCHSHQISGKCQKISCGPSVHRCTLCGSWRHGARCCSVVRIDVVAAADEDLASRSSALETSARQRLREAGINRMINKEPDCIWKCRIGSPAPIGREDRLVFFSKVTRVSSDGRFLGVGNTADYLPPSLAELSRRWPSGLPVTTSDEGRETLYRLPTSSTPAADRSYARTFHGDVRRPFALLQRFVL